MNIVEVELDSLDLRYGKLRARRPALEKRLMASLEEAGQHSPVIVVAGEEPGRWVLIEGRKRVRALKRLKVEAVKAVVWELAPAQALIAAYQLQDGSGWNALEEGWLVWELVRGDGLSLAEVGRRLERSKAWVSGRLGLIEGLPEQVLEGDPHPPPDPGKVEPIQQAQLPAHHDGHVCRSSASAPRVRRGGRSSSCRSCPGAAGSRAATPRAGAGSRGCTRPPG